MKKLQKIVLKLFLLNLFFVPAFALFTDVNLPKVVNITKAVDRSSIGFEWKSLAHYTNITGINIYRAKARPGLKQVYTKIASIPNRFATHYVDTSIEANTKYFYTFTTYSGLSESLYGEIVPVKTPPPYRKVKVASAEVVFKDTVKILWIPSPEPQIYKYKIFRQKDNLPWIYLNTVKGRLYPEYIDTTAFRGHTYSYRVVAYDANGMPSVISEPLIVKVK